MDHAGMEQTLQGRRKRRLFRSGSIASLGAAILATGATPGGSGLGSAPATAQAQPAARLPAPPANGIMGFVVNRFTYSVIQGKDACPEGLAMRNREIFLNSLPLEERERIQKKEHEREFTQRWRASLMNSEGANMCSQYILFPDRPPVRTNQSKFAWGLDLDGDANGGPKDPDTCEHEAFTSPDGEQGIDNQAYRALGCKLEWRGADGIQGDIVRGFENTLGSGETTQLILLRGVDSLLNDDQVEVIYGNTPDRPPVDATGKYIWHASYNISDEFPRFRNVLRGRIVNGVLNTDTKDIKLTKGPASVRRIQFELQKGRLRLAFQPDGTVKGLVGGYQSMHVFVSTPSQGGMGSLMTAGIDCAGEYNTLVKLADGLRDPKTGKCTAISTAFELAAVPAFVNDVPVKKVASR